MIGLGSDKKGESRNSDGFLLGAPECVSFAPNDFLTCYCIPIQIVVIVVGTCEGQRRKIQRVVFSGGYTDTRWVPGEAISLSRLTISPSPVTISSSLDTSLSLILLHQQAREDEIIAQSDFDVFLEIFIEIMIGRRLCKWPFEHISKELSEVLLKA